MDEMIVPATPQWYRPNIFVCAPDNTLVYGAMNDLVVLKRIPGGPAEVRTIPGAHSRFILTVGLNKKWGEPNKYAVSVGEDNVIRVWNLETFEKKSSNNVFGEQKRTAVGAVFAGEDRIVSVTENGVVLIWNIVLNESKLMSDLLRIKKSQITCLSSCPHAGHLTAFGVKDGVILVADLRRDGQILYRMRGHDRSITSLSWCPAPINVFPKRPQNKVGLKKPESSEAKTESVVVESVDEQGNKVESVIVAEVEESVGVAKVETVDKAGAESIDQQGVESIDQQGIKVEAVTADGVESINQQDVKVETQPIEVEPVEKHEVSERVDKSEPVDEKHEARAVEEPKSVEKSGSETKRASSTDERESSELEEHKQGAIRKTEKRRSYLKPKKRKPRKRPDESGDAPAAVPVETDDFLAECSNLKNKILGIAQPSRGSGDRPKEGEYGEEKVDLPENRYKDDFEGENEPHRMQNRELPRIFDHSCDFFDNVAEEPEEYSKGVRDEPKEIVKVESDGKGVEKDQPNEKCAERNQPKDECVEKDQPKEKYVEEDQAKEKSVEEEQSNKKSVDENGPKEKGVEDDQSKEKGVEEDDQPKEKGAEEVESKEKSVEVAEIKKRDNRHSPGEKSDKDGGRHNRNSDRRERRKSREENGEERPPRPRRIVESEVEEPRTEYLLASAGRDKKIFIWRGGTDGRMQTFFSVPRKASRSAEYASPSSYDAICWVTPTELLVSTWSGEIVSITMPRVDNQSSVSIHKKHYNCTVFNIVTPMKYYTASNWQDKATLKIWSHDQKSVVHYDAAEKNPICLDLHTITSNITCFASSPLDPNRVAVGHRDCYVHTWDLSKTTSEKNRMPTFSKKLRGKVSALAWHPTKETVLGFGTDEGSIGIIESQKATEFRENHGKTTSLQPHFRTEIYKLEWGPITGNKTYLGLYAVSEGKLVIYDVSQPKNVAPINVEMPDKNMYLYKFAWKPDYSCLILGMKDGSVVVLNTDLQVVSTLYLDEKAFTHIAWHPEAAENNVEEFKFCNWLAAATSKGVVLYDCSLVLQKDVTNEQFMQKKLGLLDGHLKPVTGLAWSPFKSNLLVTSSSDGLVHVWDVLTKTVISTFVDRFFSQISAVIWSPSDPNLVIIGEKQIAIWNITKHSPKADTGKVDNLEDGVAEFMAEHKKALQKAATCKLEPKEKTAGVPKTVVLTGEDFAQVEIPKTIKLSKKGIVPTIYTANDDKAELQVANMRKLMNGEGFDGDDPMNLFGSQADVVDLLTAQQENHKKDFKNMYSDLIALYKGDVGTCVKEAIQDNRVTPFIISLAPMVSTKLWQEACELYAKALSEEASPDFLHAAGYYLMCHKIEGAINCLCDGSLYREALALAKCRFPKDSPIVFEVTDKWAKDCFNQGNYELASYCYISIAKYEEAAGALAKRTKPEVLEFALELATKAANSHLSAMITSKLKEIKNANVVEIKSSRLEALLDKNAASAIAPDDAQPNSITATCDDVAKAQSSDENESDLTHIKNNKNTKDISLDPPSESSGVESADSPSTEDSPSRQNSLGEEEGSAKSSPSSREGEEGGNASTKMCKIA